MKLAELVSSLIVRPTVPEDSPSLKCRMLKKHSRPSRILMNRRSLIVVSRATKHVSAKADHRVVAADAAVAAVTAAAVVVVATVAVAVDAAVAVDTAVVAVAAVTEILATKIRNS